MTYKLKNVLTFIFFSFLLYLIVLNTEIVSQSVISSATTFFYKLFPSLFPFFILSEFLINYNFTYNINVLVSKLFTFLFKINPNSSYIIVLSLFNGLPANAKLINDAYNDNLIDDQEATKLLAFTFFPSPLFVISAIGINIFNSFSIGIKILLSIYLSNFILGIILRNKNVTNKKFKIIRKNKLSFSDTLKKSITNAFSSSMIILGSIVIFTTLYNLFMPLIPFNNMINSLILSLTEMTSGINMVSLLDINEATKLIIISATLCFTGMCVLSQAKSLIDFKTDFKFIIISRLLCSVINITILSLVI